MSIEAVIFDFDGTLVASNEAKREVYFRIFEDRGLAHEEIARIVDASVMVSRTEIIRDLLAAMGPAAPADPARLAQEVERFTCLADEAVAAAPEMPGASKLLSELSTRMPLYLSSLTPLGPLRVAVQRRGWLGHFREISGYPVAKTSFLLEIARQTRGGSGALLVVGDGESDRSAAAAAGAAFHAIFKPEDLVRVLDRLEGLTGCGRPIEVAS